MNKRYYVVLVFVLFVSVLLLGFSYSKESANDTQVSLNEIISNNLRIVFSSNYEDISFSDEVERDISIINRSDKENIYSIYIKSKNLNDLYYSIDNQAETKLTSNVLYTGKLNSFGENNDQITHNIKIFNKSGNEVKISLLVKEDNNLLSEVIEKSKEAYKDEEDNIRYYGKVTNNYIKHNGDLYQIVGLINNKIKIITITEKTGKYNDSSKYLSMQDYLASYKDNVSWLNNNNDYWLDDTDGENNAYYVTMYNNTALSNKMVDHRIKEIVELSLDTIFTKGDGSITNPYEVSYGSK